MTKISNRLSEFMKLETTAGIFLMLAAALALIANNSPLNGLYSSFLLTPVAIQIGALEIAKPLLLWINDGLMAIFFFLVGLEVKREVIKGELSSLSKASLPFLAAVGGMAGPAIIYSFINWDDTFTMRGWAIPSATDIAFALGVLALLGSRIPTSLKVFLLALAIIDDIGAIVIIAIFYTENLSAETLALALAGFALLIGINRAGVKSIAPYALVGVFIWVCVLKSGVHATLAGVLTALAIPMTGKDEDSKSPLNHLEHSLHPWVAFMVLPVFAFANAGVDLSVLQISDLTAKVPLGIALGLFFGNQIMITSLTFLAVKSGIAKLPDDIRWVQIYGVACLAGVGFTMSLFIGTLAFDSPDIINQVRLGVLMGSFASAILGYTVLRLTCKERIVAEKETSTASQTV